MRSLTFLRHAKSSWDDDLPRRFRPAVERARATRAARPIGQATGGAGAQVRPHPRQPGAARGRDAGRTSAGGLERAPVASTRRSIWPRSGISWRWCGLPPIRSSGHCSSGTIPDWHLALQLTDDDGEGLRASRGKISDGGAGRDRICRRKLGGGREQTAGWSAFILARARCPRPNRRARRAAGRAARPAARHRCRTCRPHRRKIGASDNGGARTGSSAASPTALFPQQLLHAADGIAFVAAGDGSGAPSRRRRDGNSGGCRRAAAAAAAGIWFPNSAGCAARRQAPAIVRRSS